MISKCILRSSPGKTGFAYTFYRGNICSVQKRKRLSICLAFIKPSNYVTPWLVWSISPFLRSYVPFILIYYLVQNLEGSKVIYLDKPTQSLHIMLNLDYVTDSGYLAIFSSMQLIQIFLQYVDDDTMKIIVMYVKHFSNGTFI